MSSQESSPDHPSHLYPFTVDERAIILEGIIATHNLTTPSEVIHTEPGLSRALHEALQQDESIAPDFIKQCREPRSIDERVAEKTEQLRQMQRESTSFLSRVLGKIPLSFLMDTKPKVA